MIFGFLCLLSLRIIPKSVYIAAKGITSLCFMLWRWQPTPVFLPGELHGQGSLAAAGQGSLAAAGHGVLKSWTRLSYFHFTIFPCVYMCHIFFIPLSVSEHLGCCHVLAGINSAAKNIGVHVSF